MRCYFMRSGHIVDVEILDAADDAQAVEAARKLFAARQDAKLEGFEVWDRARFIHRFPASGAGTKTSSKRESA